MSRVNEKLNDKLTKGSANIVKSKEKHNTSNACKRSRSDDKVDRSTNEVTVDMSTTNEVEPVKKAVKEDCKKEN